MSTKNSSHPSSRDIALVAVFAAFIAVCAILPAFPVGVTGVPITFQTLAIYTTALVLGGLRGASATLLYVIVGLIGLPIFAGFKGGFGVLSGASAGYLVGFIPGALLMGIVAYVFARHKNTGTKILGFVLAVVVGYAVITLFGIGGMMFNLGLPFDKAFLATLPFVPGDTIKGVLSIVIAISVHRAFPNLIKA